MLSGGSLAHGPSRPQFIPDQRRPCPTSVVRNASGKFQLSACIAAVPPPVLQKVAVDCMRAEPLLQRGLRTCPSARDIVRLSDDTGNAAKHSAAAGTYLGRRPVSEELRNNETVGNVLNAIADLGDVLYVQSASSWLRGVGTAGGKFGHMMLVIKKPHRVTLNSEMGRWLRPIWPDGARELWLLQALEITRGRPGLHTAELLLLSGHHQSDSLNLIGELYNGHADMTDQVVDVWQIPEKVKSTFNEVLFQETLEEMRQLGSKSWSWTAAARSILKTETHCLLDQTMQADSISGTEAEHFLHQVKEAWDSEAICTSVVVAFWQRYLVKLAKVNYPPELNDVKAAQLILQCMPLKADCCLPGDVMSAMERCGWSLRVSRRRPAAQRRTLCDECGWLP